MEKKRFGKPRKKLNHGFGTMTSLMDVLTIILIFLLVNYSENIQNVDIPSFISLPTINGGLATQFDEDIKVIIGMNKMSINGQLINFHSFERESDHILEKASRIMASIKENQDRAGKKGRISLKADEKVSFEVIDRFLVSASTVGYTNIDLLAYTK